MRKWVMPALPHHLLNIGSFEIIKPVLMGIFVLITTLTK